MSHVFLRSVVLPVVLCLTLAACESAEEKAQAHFERGMELLEAGDDARARIEFRNALREVSTFVEPRIQLARLNYADGTDHIAFKEYLRISEQQPENLEAHTRLAELAFLGRSWDAFETHAQAATRLNAEDSDVKVIDLALRYRQAVEAEDETTRRALIREAEALDSDSQVIRQILLDGYVSQQRLDDALSQIELMILDDPDNIEFYNAKVQILAMLGREDAIEQELGVMIERFPDNEDLKGNYLQFLVARGKLDTAEQFLRNRIAAAPEDEKPVIGLIQFQLRLRDRATAMNELDSQIAGRSAAYMLRTLRASMRFDDGEQDSAIADLQEVVDELAGIEEKSLDDITKLQDIKVSLAAMLLRSGNEVGARRLVEEILADDPNVVGALKMRARWRIADDDTDGAINDLRTALASSGQDTEAMTIMAQAYQRAGNRPLMMDFLSLAAESSNNAPEESLRYAAALREGGKLPQAEAVLISALRMRPNTPAVIVALGQLYVEMDDAVRLRDVIRTLRRDPEGNAAAIANLELKLVEMSSGTEDALAYLDSLAEQNADNPNLKIALIRAHLQNNNPDAAMAFIDEAIAAEPDNASFIYLRAITLAAQGELDEATTVFSDLIDENPQSPDIWLQLARLQNARGETEAAEETIDRALEANPGAPNLLWAKASMLQKRSDIDGAIAIYEGLYEENSSSVIVANNLASLLATFRRDEDSLERARIIARRLQGTTVPAFQDTYGWILHRSGETEDALPYLEAAARDLPDDPAVQYHLGVVYEALGQKEQALEQMEKATEMLGPLSTTNLAGEITDNIEKLRASMASGE